MAKASLMGMGEVLMWKANEDDALAAFTQCKPDRTVDGNGLVAFWSKGETYCATVKELQKLKDQGKRFPLNDHLSVELGGYVDSPDLAALVHGKGLVPATADSEGHSVGPTVEIFVHEKERQRGNEVSHRALRAAPLLAGGKTSGRLSRRVLPSAGAGAGRHLDRPAGQAGLSGLAAEIGPRGRLGRSRDRQDGRHVFDGGRRERDADDRHAICPSAADSASAITPTEVVLPQPFDKGDRGDSKCVNLRVTLDRLASGHTAARNVLAQAESARTVGERAAAAGA